MKLQWKNLKAEAPPVKGLSWLGSDLLHETEPQYLMQALPSFTLHAGELPFAWPKHRDMKGGVRDENAYRNWEKKEYS